MIVSAIVPTYNRAETLARALESIFSQTRPPDEVLVVDDASTDETAATAARFPGATLIRLEQNSGAAAARNAGIRRARGDWLAFLDSDDVWAPDKLERQLARAASAPSPDLVCTGITVYERSGRCRRFSGSEPQSSAGWSFADFQNYPFCPTTWLVRRQVFEEEGLFDESLRNAEDLDFLARLAHRRIEILPEPLATKFNRQDSLDASLYRTAQSYEVLFERHARLWARAPGAAVRSYRRLAHMHLSANSVPSARTALLKGLGYRPWDLRSWGLLAATLLGIRAVDAARRIAARLS